MTFNKSKLAIALTLATLAGSNGIALAANAKDSSRVLVQFKEQHTNQGKADLKGLGATIKKDLPHHNAVSISIPTAKLEALSKNKNIEFYEEDPKRYPIGMTRDAPSNKDKVPMAAGGETPAQVTPYGISMVQADQVTGNTSSGISVCVIDSGYSMGHEDKPGFDMVTGTDDPGAGPWTQDGSGHGSHTSGTINALDNDVGVIGVFPNAPMHIVRVFGDDGIWAYSSDLIAALDDCVDHGAKVVSMSLGADRASVLENMAFRKAEKEGVLSIAAAGNDGDGGYDRMSYPASYHSVMSVAAVDSTMTVAAFSQKNTMVEIAAPGVSVLSTVPVGSQMDVTLNDFVAIPMDGFEIPAAPITAPIKTCGLGESAADCEGAAAGKICLIERGGFTFAQKALSCEAAGGVAAAIYNREGETGNVYGTLGGTEVSIPVVGMLRADGLTLSDGDVATLSFTPTGYDYDYFSGTSMATPHVAGVAALIWSNFPQCTGSQIRNAMNASALDLGTPGEDHAYGNGLVQAKAALDYLAANGCNASE